jgi:hypothetical protein
MALSTSVRRETLPAPRSSDDNISVVAARLSIGAATAVLVLLAALHVLSSEFDPSWRMVSEYADGRYGWVLSLMFAAWAISSWALVCAIRSQLRTRSGRIGLAILIAAGVGEAMACVFDINNQPLHDMAGYIGILGLPIAAMLISVPLSRIDPWCTAKRALMWAANLTWISVVLMATSLIALIITYTHAGGRIPTDGKALPLGTILHPGVIALVGYVNRALVVAYCAWVIIVAWQTTRLRNRPLASDK